MSRFVRWLPAVVLAALPTLVPAAAPPMDELPGYRTVATALTARVRPETARTATAGYFGVRVDERGVVADVDAGSAADRAGLRPGDVLRMVAGERIAGPADVRRVLDGRAAGSAVDVTAERGGKEITASAKLDAVSRTLPDEGPREGLFGWDAGRRSKAWSKPVYRVAAVLIDYPDAKANPKITTKDWEDSLFSTNTYRQKSATGQKVYGSMNDHFLEQSYQTFRIEGKAFPPVLVTKKRDDYGKQGAVRQALLTEALDLVLARDGNAALDGFDGVYFLYSGDRMRVARGSLYWPHRSSVRHKGKSWPYFICPEGGSTMYNISVLSHEFGHMLGLPDLYARPENPGSEGLGQWCLMSNQTPNGRPQHMSAWCKERLGWVTPTTIDPAVPQKLVLSPIYKSPREVFKVLARPDGSEYFLLENRAPTGFDASLPAHGLLIWRVVRGRPILEESHGVGGPAGPRTSATLVPFPSKANDAFTPYTVPSSRPQLGGGTPVHITNIRRLPDGRVTFQVGYEFY